MTKKKKEQEVAEEVRQMMEAAAASRRQSPSHNIAGYFMESHAGCGQQPQPVGMICGLAPLWPRPIRPWGHGSLGPLGPLVLVPLWPLGPLFPRPTGSWSQEEVQRWDSWAG